MPTLNQPVTAFQCVTQVADIKVSRTQDEILNQRDASAWRTVLNDHKVTFRLAPELWACSDNYQLTWQAIPFTKQHVNTLPEEKGLYAFAICANHPDLPPTSYIVYLGIAGIGEERTLRKRCKDYLRLPQSRAKIEGMIERWGPVLQLYYAQFKNNDIATLRNIEECLLSMLTPPFNTNDLKGVLKRAVEMTRN